MKYKVEILKNTNEIEGAPNFEVEHEFWVDEKPSLLDLLIKNKIKIDHSCDANATCGTCKVQLMKGTLSPKTKQELDFCRERSMKENERLSCQSQVKSDIIIKI